MEQISKKISGWTQQVMLLIRLHRYDSAEKLVDAYLSELESVELYNLKGVILQRQSFFKQAIEEFKKGLKLSPDHIESSLNLIATYADTGLYKEANQLYKKITDPKKKFSSEKI